jgi:hypothetical protein
MTGVEHHPIQIDFMNAWFHWVDEKNKLRGIVMAESDTKYYDGVY